MDKEPYRVARELLEKYDPTNPALKSTTPTRPRQDDDRSGKQQIIITCLFFNSS